jgi:hypothetical protein
MVSHGGSETETDDGVGEARWVRSRWRGTMAETGRERGGGYNEAVGGR